MCTAYIRIKMHFIHLSDMPISGTVFMHLSLLKFAKFSQSGEQCLAGKAWSLFSSLQSAQFLALNALKPHQIT